MNFPPVVFEPPVSEGLGFRIKWQDGTVPEFSHNGATPSDIIIAVRERLEFFQTNAPELANEFNVRAIEHLNCALEELSARVADRQERGVYGTPAP